MKALLFYDRRDIRLEEIKKPAPGNDEVLLKVTDCGLCQTQVDEFAEGPYILNKEPHPLTDKCLPLVMGHEFGGTVEEVGDDVSSEWIGQQVAVLPLIKCGECEYCKSDRENLCEQFAYYGLGGENGGFTEYAVIKETNIIPVKDSSILTFIEPLLVAIHASGKIKHYLDNKRVLILGAGTIGTSMSAVLRDVYHADITLYDILPNRLQKLSDLGFKIIDKEKLSHEKFDIVIDCAGSDHMSKESAFLKSFDHLKKGGLFVGIGAYFHPLSFVPVRWVISENTLIHSFSYTQKDVEQLPHVIEKINVDFSLVCDNIKLDNVIEDGFYRFEIDKDSFTRLVVKC